MHICRMKIIHAPVLFKILSGDASPDTSKISQNKGGPTIYVEMCVKKMYSEMHLRTLREFETFHDSGRKHIRVERATPSTKKRLIFSTGYAHKLSFNQIRYFTLTNLQTKQRFYHTEFQNQIEFFTG